MDSWQASLPCCFPGLSPSQVLPQLLFSPDPLVLLFAALSVYHLAAMPHLKESLGEAGTVDALVTGMRR